MLLLRAPQTGSAPPGRSRVRYVGWQDSPYAVATGDTWSAVECALGDDCEPAAHARMQRRPGGVGAAPTVYAAAGMCGSGCEIQAGDRCLRASETGHRPEDELLVQSGRTTVDRPAHEIAVVRLHLSRELH